MPKRTSKQNEPDVNQLAQHLVRMSTEEPTIIAPRRVIEIRTGKAVVRPVKVEREKNPAAVSLGRLGGLRGGKVRAERLSTERKREIAQAAARARWERATQ